MAESTGKKEKTKKEIGYTKYVKSKEPETKYFPSLVTAFIVGGFICVLGQGIGALALLIWPHLSDIDVAAIIASTLVFLAALLTGLGLYDRMGLYAGAGTIVPITGFSNSITAAAMEYRSEGLIFGMAAKMFTIAGPVIVNGVASAIIVGFVYLIFGL